MLPTSTALATDSPNTEVPEILAARHIASWRVAAAVLTLAIFVLDRLTQIGIVLPMLYVLPTVLFVWTGRIWDPFVVAASATLLAAGEGVFPPMVAGGAIEMANRALALIVVWVTAAGVAVYRRVVERAARQALQDRREIEASVRRLRELRYAIDQSAIVATTDQRGIITFANDKFCEISKYSREELVGHDHRIVNSGFHPPEFIRDLWKTIAQGGVWRGEIRNRAKDGSIYWVDTTIVPFTDERRKPWQYLAIRSDITQRKLAEKQLLDQASLAQLGQLAAVVAHEVRNPLAGLKGSLQVLEGRLPTEMREREIIGAMIERIDALTSTVRDILLYARPNEPKPVKFDLGQLLTDVVVSARAAVPAASIAVSVTRLEIEADPEMTRAVLLNVLINACEAGVGAPVEIVTARRDGFAEIEVLDRGPGLPESVREQVFEPFVTTKRTGTGLGLAIARRLTLLQGGSITLSRRDAGGTAARIRLPLAQTNN